MNNKTLVKILHKHSLWIKGEKAGERANLSGVNLEYLTGNGKGE